MALSRNDYLEATCKMMFEPTHQFDNVFLQYIDIAISFIEDATGCEDPEPSIVALLVKDLYETGECRPMTMKRIIQKSF